MSTHSSHQNHEENTHENEGFLTPRGKATLKKNGWRLGWVGVGVLGVLGAIYGPQACQKKDYRALNQQGLESYDNNAREITMSRLFASAHMFEANSTTLVEDSFSNLWEQIDRTLDKKNKFLWFEGKSQNSHGVPRNSGGVITNPSFDSYHCYIGINQEGSRKDIIISWHSPEPTAEQKRQWIVGTHKVVLSHFDGQNVVQRSDYYTDGRNTSPQSINFNSFTEFLKQLTGLYN